MAKIYAQKEVLYNEIATPIQLHDGSTVMTHMPYDNYFFIINNDKINMQIDANSEPTRFIMLSGEKLPVEYEYTGFEAKELCFETLETASEETGLPAALGYIHSTYDFFVEVA